MSEFTEKQRAHFREAAKDKRYMPYWFLLYIRDREHFIRECAADQGQEVAAWLLRTLDEATCATLLD